jgi:hypothetical protein
MKVGTLISKLEDELYAVNQIKKRILENQTWVQAIQGQDITWGKASQFYNFISYQQGRGKTLLEAVRLLSESIQKQLVAVQHAEMRGLERIDGDFFRYILGDEIGRI